jgi:UDP-glucuronate decarboxylase
VDDLIEGMLRLMDQDEHTGPVNIGNPVEHTMLELAETVIRATGSSSRVAFRPLPMDDPRKRCPDITRARQWLNWTPQFSLVSGLERTIDWYRDALKQGQGVPKT